MEKVKNILTYFVVIGILLIAPLAKKIAVPTPLDLFVASLIVFFISIFFTLTESFIMKIFKQLRHLKINHLIGYSVCLIFVIIICGGEINDFLLKTTLPEEVFLEVLSDTGSERAKANIWIIHPSISVIEYDNFTEIEDNHYISETGIPWMKIKVSDVKESDIVLSCDSESSAIRISFDGYSKTYNCYKSVPEQKTLSLIYHNQISVFRILSYGSIVLLVSTILYMIIIILIKCCQKTDILKRIVIFPNLDVNKKNTYVLFFIFGMIFSLYGFINFNMVNLHMTTGKDGTVWYWCIGDRAFFQNGKISFENYIDETEKLAFRGYLIPVIYTSIKIVFGRWMKIEPLYFCFVILSFMASFLNNILMPFIYKTFNKKSNLHIGQIILLNVCFFVFLRGHILWPMADLFPFFFIMCSMCFWLKFIETNNNKFLFGNLFILMAGILCRRNYAVLFYAEMVWLIVWIRKNSLGFSNLVKLILNVFGSIFLICSPQIIINQIRNGSWEYLGGTLNRYAGSQSLVESSMQLSLDKATQAWPYFLENALGPLMKNSIYPGMEELQLMDFFYIFISHPLECMSFMISKLFMAIDIRSAMIYPQEPYIDLGGYGILVLIFNAMIWSVFCLSICGKTMMIKFYKREERIMGLIAMLLLFIPLLAVHIEWRYFMPIYYLAYYSFCFCFPKWFADAKKEGRKSFLVCLIILMIAFITISINNYANFSWNNPGGIIF